MADNALFIVDLETGDFVCIAKALGGSGWELGEGGADAAKAFIEAHDWEGSLATGPRTRLRFMTETDAVIGDPQAKDIVRRWSRGEGWKPKAAGTPVHILRRDGFSAICGAAAGTAAREEDAPIPFELPPDCDQRVVCGRCLAGFRERNPEKKGA